MIRLTENIQYEGNRHFHFFTAGKKNSALIECGVSSAALDMISKLDGSPEPVPRLSHLVAMHAHFDHVCGIPVLKERFPDAVLTASPKGANVLAKLPILEGFFSQDESMTRTLFEQGLVPAITASPAAAIIRVEHTVTEGDVITPEPGVRLEILSAPGHTSDGIAIYLASDRGMFISDAAGFQISDTAIFPIFFQSYPAYMDTINRLKSYPTEVIGLPHGRIRTGRDVEAFYDLAISSAEEAFTIIRSMTDDGTDPDDMRKILFNRYYRGDLRIYTSENITTCVDLLIKRVQECL